MMQPPSPVDEEPPTPTVATAEDGGSSRSWTQLSLLDHIIAEWEAESPDNRL